MNRSINRLKAEIADTTAPIQDGTVIRYARRFEQGPQKVYFYAAMHIGGLWYTTSKARGQRWAYDHESFMRLLRSEQVYGVQIASAFEAIETASEAQNLAHMEGDLSAARQAAQEAGV